MPFRHQVEVQVGDIDELGHASNLVYLRWTLDAALAHSTAVGLDQRAYLDRGEGWVVRRHEIDYLRPAFAGEQLVVETRVTAFGAASSLRRTSIVRPSDGALLCSATTEWAYVGFARGRPRRIPDEVRMRFPIEPDDDGRR